MKEVKQYKCEYCGTLYADKSECAACEKQHTVPCKIVAVHHRAKCVCAVYPPRIDVGFSDGSVQHYTLYRPPMPGSIPKGAIAVSTWGSRRSSRKSIVLRGERLITAGSLRRRKCEIMS